MAEPLAQRHCKACTPGTPALSRRAAEDLLQHVTGWTIQQRESRLELNKTFKFKGFRPGMAFVQTIGEIAEAEDHHPALCLEYGRLSARLWTHVAGGLTENDFILAARIDAALGGA